MFSPIRCYLLIKVAKKVRDSVRALKEVFVSRLLTVLARYAA